MINDWGIQMAWERWIKSDDGTACLKALGEDEWGEKEGKLYTAFTAGAAAVRDEYEKD